MTKRSGPTAPTPFENGIRERPEEASTFERFTKVLRALVAVPKAELNQLLAKEKEEKHAKRVLTKSQYGQELSKRDDSRLR